VESLSLTGLDYPERVQAAKVTVGFFEALGARPLAGRVFEPGQDRAGGETHVALLTEAFWARRFGRDAAVLGRRLVLDGEPYRVTGVMPADDFWLASVDVIVPLVRTGDDQRGSFELGAVGRLKPGVSIGAAQADLDAVAASLVRSFPKVNDGLGLAAQSSASWIASDTLRRSLWLLMGAVALLLLIACVNLSNMQLSRAAGRTRETAVRTAMGATRARLVRQLLTESLVISAAGALAGVGLAAGLLALARRIQVDDVPRLAQASINGWALAVAVAAMVATAAIIALFPALQGRRRSLVPALREGERSVSGSDRQHRLRGALVAAEVALSLMLLVGAGLLLRSLHAVLSVDRGFATDDRVVLAVNMPTAPDIANPTPAEQKARAERVAAFLRTLLDGVAGIPGVQAAAAVSGRPLVGGSTGLGLASPDKPDPPDVPWGTWRLVSPDYFRVLGLPVVKGRVFVDGDRMETPRKIVISQRVADQLYPGEDPHGAAARGRPGTPSRAARPRGGANGLAVAVASHAVAALRRQAERSGDVRRCRRPSGPRGGTRVHRAGAAGRARRRHHGAPHGLIRPAGRMMAGTAHWICRTSCGCSRPWASGSISGTGRTQERPDAIPFVRSRRAHRAGHPARRRGPGAAPIASGLAPAAGARL
jgi:putative ABC transport system permease protein